MACYRYVAVVSGHGGNDGDAGVVGEHGDCLNSRNGGRSRVDGVVLIDGSHDATARTGRCQSGARAAPGSSSQRYLQVFKGDHLHTLDGFQSESWFQIRYIIIQCGFPHEEPSQPSLTSTKIRPPSILQGESIRCSFQTRVKKRSAKWLPFWFRIRMRTSSEAV